MGASRWGVGRGLRRVSGAGWVERLPPVCPRLSSNLPGASAAALPGDADGAGLQGEPLPRAGAIDSRTERALARPLRARADRRARFGGRPRPAGSPDGAPVASPLSSSGEPAFGQPSAAGAGCAVQLFALSRSGRDQLASGTSHPAHGSDAQSVGRESHPGGRENAKYLGQPPANLPAAGEAWDPDAPTVVMLPAAHDPGLGRSNTLNKYLFFLTLIVACTTLARNRNGKDSISQLCAEFPQGQFSLVGDA